jgi:sugar phosphate isomerase/epimerase
MLNGMAGADFELCARRHVELGLAWLDLKDGIFGETINDLSLANAQRVAEIAQAHQLGVFCFSTSIGFTNLEEGEAKFRARHLPTVEHVIALAAILRPLRIRLISPTLKPFPVDGKTVDVVERRHPWVFDVYREMIDRLVAAKQRVLLENETPDVIFNSPEAIVRFFARLDRNDRVRYTWDAQNLWQMGVFPTMEVYRTLKPLIGCIHLKGGRTDGTGRELVHASALEDASWPVAEIVNAALRDGVAPFLSLNPSHGKRPAGWSGWDVTKRDAAFLRRAVSSTL